MGYSYSLHLFSLYLVTATFQHSSAERYLWLSQEPQDAVVLRNRPYTLPCNISGVKGYTVSWLKDGQKLNLINDQRRSIMPEGSLHFTTIQRQKKPSTFDQLPTESDAGTYQCIGTIQKNGNPFKLVSKKATLTIAGMSKSFSKRPANLTVEEGETAYFQCKIKRSRPKAVVTWSVQGRNTDLTLNFRFVVLPSGILEIRSVMKSDAGVYVCTVTNKVMKRSVQAQARLIVQKAFSSQKTLKFFTKPKDTTTVEKQDVILECIIIGYPRKPAVWLKDGQPLSMTGRYSIYGADNLKIKAVQLSDGGKYECTTGSLKASAYVQVVVPAKIIKPPRDMVEKEFNSIQMSCEASGEPKPKITWYFNGDTTSDIGYILVKNGTISIQDIMHSDEGIYQCFAENQGGVVQSAAQLNVLLDEDVPTTTQSPTTQAPTKLVPLTAPNNVKAKVLGSNAILVSWDTPAGYNTGILNYTIVITTEGRVLRMVKTNETLFNVTHLNQDTTYSFSVFASNGREKGQISKETQATTTSLIQDKTSKPRQVFAQAISSSAIKISWQTPSFISSAIQNYTVLYQDSDKTLPESSKTSFKLQTVLLNLQPYTVYNIRVTAMTSTGLGRPSDITTVRTKSGIPKGPPTRVKLFEINGVLIVEWLKPVEPNGNITSYELRLRNENSGVVKSSTTKETRKIFQHVQKSTTYSFCVAALTEAGKGEFSKWKTLVMSQKAMTESVVPGAPINLKTRLIQGMVEVTWDPPAEKHIIVRKYVLTCGRGAPGLHGIDIENDTTSYLLNNLKPGLFYIIHVKAANNKGQGKEAMERVDVPYDSPRPSVGLFDLKAISFANRSIMLRWRDTLQITHGVVYNIKYFNNNHYVYINTSEQHHEIKNLMPGKVYTFYIKRDNQDIYPKEQIVKNWTKEQVPSVPKDITIKYEAEEGFVRVQWNTPDEMNGVILNYKICWKLKQDAKQNWTCVTVKGYELNERISPIQDNETYVVKIRAKNKAGEGVYTQPKTFHGKKVIFPVKNLSGTTSKPSVSDIISKEKKKGAKTAAGNENPMGDRTLWIVIAVIGALTLVAIVVISVILCKKNTGGGDSIHGFKPKKCDPYKAVANGATHKKKGAKENYWIKQNNMEMSPYKKKDDSNTINSIPRNADEMKPLESPFQSRKNQNNSLPASDDEMPDENRPGSSFAGDNLTALPADYFKPATPVNIYNSPFTQPEPDEFPAPPPPEVIEDKFDDGPATSSDYGSEELMTPPVDDDNEQQQLAPVSYLPTSKTPNGYVTVATDYDYPNKEHTTQAPDSAALQNLMRDLDAIMAKEDRV